MTDRNRERFEQLLAAKKQAAGKGAPAGSRPADQAAKPQPAKGGKGFTRRKV